jgi:hypothetical protein
MWLTGQMVKLMMLGGLARAVGILVDEATRRDGKLPSAGGILPHWA